MNKNWHDVTNFVKEILVRPQMISLNDANRIMSVVFLSTKTSLIDQAMELFDSRKKNHTPAYNNGYLQALKDIQRMTEHS